MPIPILGLLNHDQGTPLDPSLFGLYLGSNLLIAAAGYAICFALIFFLRKRSDAPFRPLLLLFGAFAIASSSFALLEVWTIWHPSPLVEGLLKAATAVIATLTAVALIRALPTALRLPNPQHLRQLNESLEASVRQRTAELSGANESLRREVAQREKAETEVRRLNVELQQRVRELESLFEALPIGVCIMRNREERSVWINGALAEMLGLPPQPAVLPSDAALTNLRILQNGRPLAATELPLRRAQAENLPLLGSEMVIERDNGVRLHVIANAVPLRDETRRAVGCVATFQDISAHISLEEELRLVIEAAPNALIKVDKDGLISLVNGQTERLFGYKRDELIGRPVEILVAGQAQATHAALRAGFFARPATRMMGGGREFPGRRKDGSEVPIEIGLNPIRTSRGLAALVSIIDVSERRQADGQRLLIERKIQETQKLESLGVLAGGIAHDFNNLLTGILGNASIARLDLPSTSAVVPVIEQIEIAARRAADLCRQMLAYSGKGRFVVQRLDLNQVIRETTHLLSISISKSCVLRFNLADKLPAISADATQIRQIVMNLVINASEAIGERSGVIALTTGVARVDDAYIHTLLYNDKVSSGDYVFLEVSDNGSGMDAATLARIFDPFFTTKFTGRGLGLAAVLGIIRGHNGAIKVYSEPGRGSTFKILFPCIDGPVEPAPGSRESAGKFRGQGLALVVDDEETVRSVAARILESAGYEVRLANDGREAVEIYRHMPSRFAIVLLDLTMPHMDGEETFRQFRHINPGVKVILMSGFNQQEAINRFTGKGLAGFVQKPFEVDSLIDAVRQVALNS